MKKLIRLMSVVLVAVALVACGSKGARTPEKAAEKFLKEYQAENYEGLLSRCIFLKNSLKSKRTNS